MKRRNGSAVIADGRMNPPQESKKEKLQGVVVGLLIALDDAGMPYVDYPGCGPDGQLARTTASLSTQQVGHQVALMFEEGDLRRPIIMGVIQSPQAPSARAQGIPVKIDGEAIVLTAEQEIVLKCGEASLTLTREGKIQLRGTYLISRSSGVNRIQGGSIELN